MKATNQEIRRVDSMRIFDQGVKKVRIEVKGNPVPLIGNIVEVILGDVEETPNELGDTILWRVPVQFEFKINDVRSSVNGQTFFVNTFEIQDIGFH